MKHEKADKMMKQGLTFFLSLFIFLNFSPSLFTDSLCYANGIGPAVGEEESSSEKTVEPVQFNEAEGKDETEFAVVDSFEEQVEAKELAKEKKYPGFKGPLGMSFYWDKGLHMRGKYENFQFLIGGNIYYDTGRIKSDRELDRVFPNLDGSHHDIRQLRLHTSAILMKAIEIRLDMDFTNNKQLMDNWIRISNIPVLNRFRFGHIKQPFSLEYTTSSRYITFMERSLPVSAFSPGRNFGVRFDRGVSDKRFTWSAGAFVITGTAEDLSDLREQIDEHIGYSLAFRASGLPYYSEEEKKLLHLGLSFTHHFIDDVSKSRKWGISTYPESRIQDDVKLVDTGLFEADNADILNLELAYVNGPFSLQSEYIVSFIDAEKSLRFWGIYASGSYFFTGEQRQYNRASGAFTGVDVKSPFHPAKGQWGALELAARLSYVDLNDEPISGGKEKNITLGLNWYLYQKIRLMFDYIHAKVYDRAKPEIDDANADIYMLRFQFSI